MNVHWRHVKRIFLLLLLLTALLGAARAATASPKTRTLNTTYNGNPGNYRTLLSSLTAGDTLLLEAGTYTLGLPISNLNGTAANPIIIAGPESGSPAVFEAQACCNTVSIRNSSYIEIRNLEIDGLNMANIDAVKAEGDASWAHHITLENLYIHSHNANQQTVGISTKCPAWDWIIRKNVIDTAGTGMYLGNSDGSAHFINGLIEGNLIKDTTGYNIQIKHQTGSRPTGLGAPASGTTTIRHNVLSKASGYSTGGSARPNLLVGHWPLSGDGANDVYEIYGNFFYQNPSGEPLFQGEGNIALYDNLFVNRNGDAIWIQPHNDVPKLIRVFNNTILADDTGTSTGVYLTGGTPSQQKIIGNAVFADSPIDAPAQTQSDNVTNTYNNAANYLVNPTAAPGLLDLFPLANNLLMGAALDTTTFQAFQDWDRDFNIVQHTGLFRGAYSGQGTNPGWLPKLERKPLGDIRITGAITEDSSGLAGVSFDGSGLSCNSSDGSGAYSCFVVSGWSGTITPTKFGYIFTPTHIVHSNVTTHTSGNNYLAGYTLTETVYLPIIQK